MQRTYFFGIYRGALSEREQSRREDIAKDNDCDFVYGKFPGEGFKSWFACANLGAPFDRATEREVMTLVGEGS